jgi:hypothetical protein
MHAYLVSEIQTRISAQYQMLIAMGEQKNVILNTAVNHKVLYTNL